MVSLVSNQYNKVHNFFADNVFNTPGKQTVGRVVAAAASVGVLVGGAYWTITTANVPVCVEGAKAFLANATLERAKEKAQACASELPNLAVTLVKGALTGVGTVFFAKKAIQTPQKIQEKQD